MKHIIILTVFFFNTAYAVKCADFDTQAEAQAYYESGKYNGRKLDRDKNGEACECLYGGSSYHKDVCKWWRDKNNKD